MKVLILGGDGYLGWPTAMHLASRGHTVAVVDNYLRRTLWLQTGVRPLFEVPDVTGRIARWAERSSDNIGCYIGDLRNWSFVEHVFKDFQPNAVVHYAEQPSAPYSMMGREEAFLTLRNNLEVTANIIFAVHEFCQTAQIVKL